MVDLDRVKSWGKSYLGFLALHFFTFVIGIAVAALYGTDVERARQAGVPSDSKWVFAIVVGALGVILSILYAIPFVLSILLPWASIVLFALSLSVFGVFGSMYIKEDPEGNEGIIRMKNAVWVDLAQMLLWLISSLAGFVYFWRNRDRRSRFTGRARV